MYLLSRVKCVNRILQNTNINKNETKCLFEFIMTRKFLIIIPVIGPIKLVKPKMQITKNIINKKIRKIIILANYLTKMSPYFTKSYSKCATRERKMRIQTDRERARIVVTAHELSRRINVSSLSLVISVTGRS